jgi:hypothetical protein
MKSPSLQIQEELLLAKQSRIEGNEGRARVCARRAAGAAAQSYLLRVGFSGQSENVLDSLLMLKKELELPERVVTAIDCLLKRVDLDYNLPPDVDLITEAEAVIQFINSSEND